MYPHGHVWQGTRRGPLSPKGAGAALLGSSATGSWFGVAGATTVFVSPVFRMYIILLGRSSCSETTRSRQIDSRGQGGMIRWLVTE